jgi:predicted nucleic acid-binding protein
MSAPYVDTSALAKWYLNEPRSEDFERFAQRHARLSISRLAALELRSLLARRRRAGDVTRRIERDVLAAFAGDLRSGVLEVAPLEDAIALEAERILARARRVPLRTLDALHLATARALGAERFATADRVQARAARSLRLKVTAFY